MFGNNKDAVTQTQLDEALSPLLERIKTLEDTVAEQAKLIAVLKKACSSEAEANTKETSLAACEIEHDSYSQMPSELAQAQERLTHPQTEAPLKEGKIVLTQTYYLPAPTPDGYFKDESATEQVGKSIYALLTDDGKNGRFCLINSSDAVATAAISVSQFVKPACRIEGNTHQIPRRIITIEEGLAQKEGEMWRVVRKARVSFE